jgi:hypothetical protein
MIWVFFLRFHWIDMKWPDHVYFSFYGRFHIKMFKKACLHGKEHFNLLVLGSLRYWPEDCLFRAGLSTQQKSPGFSIFWWKIL